MERLLLTAFAVIALYVSMVSAENAVKYQQHILDLHNDYRSKQQASNMQRLKWSDKLADIADSWVKRCHFDHENKGFGENLYTESAPVGDDLAKVFDNATAAWYSEIVPYQKANQKGCAGPGACHYTQMVWFRTREVGCAYHVCPSIQMFGMTAKNMIFIGCWYDPKGNYATMWPFEKGNGVCTDCYEGQYCEDALCTGEGEEPCVDVDKECRLYKETGHCEDNKLWMEMNCRQSCEFCKGGEKLEDCEDEDDNCPRYVKSLNEARFKETCARPYMKAKCRVSCKLC